jgi:hypothetical protein
MNGRRAPKKDELINVVLREFGVNRRESVLAKVISFTEVTSGSRTRYTVFAAEEDNGNPPGHREAIEADFETQ